MSRFKEILESLPKVENIEILNVLNAESPAKIVSVIENKPGKSGSVAVYYSLTQEFDQLNALAATAGLQRFGEHVEDAKSRPGAHPNIDFLIDIIENDSVFNIEVIKR